MISGSLGHCAIRFGVGDEERGYNPNNWGLEKNQLKVPSRAIIKARGKTFEAISDYAYGDAWDEAPRYTDEDVIEKFRRMARTMVPYSKRWEARIDRMVDRVLHIDEIDDVRELTALFAPVG